MRRTPSALVWAAVLALPLVARARPGDPDPSFGTGGQVVTSISSGYDAAGALVVQPDGKLVAAGYASSAGDPVFAVARYAADGTLDGTFGAGGKVSTAVALRSAVSALVLQPDGKLVAGGYADNGTSSTFALVRYAANGSLDPSFGSGGKITTAFGRVDDEVLTLLLQPDGKLVAAGYTKTATATAFALARYNANGSLDPTFGTGGKVTTAIGSVDDEAFALVLQPDGKLVAAGYTVTGAATAFALARYDASGNLDTSFGTGGTVKTSIGGVDDEVFALVLQPDGKLVAAGYGDTGTAVVVALARYGAGGSLDPTFGTGGKVTTPIGSVDDEAFALVLQPDGALVAAGYMNDGANQDFGLVRYGAQGALDATFGTGGKVVTPVSSGYAGAASLVLQSDGKLVAAGYAYNGTDTDFALARYLGQVCGDGVRQSPEECDDGTGNGTLASCCTTTCAFRASGTACTDGNPCTYHDTCNGGGSCAGTGIGCTSDACALRTCNGTETCTVTPLPCSTTTTTSTVPPTPTTTTSTTTAPPTTTSSSTTAPTTSTTSTTSTAPTSTTPPSTTTSTAPDPTGTSATTATPPTTTSTSSTSTVTSTSATSTSSSSTAPTTTETSTTWPTTTIEVSTTTTTTTAVSTTSTTTPCPDGFAGVPCLLRTAFPPPDCAGETIPRAVQRRVSQATAVADQRARNARRARTSGRKTSRILKQAATLAAKGGLSPRCAAALGEVLREAERRAETVP